MADPPNPLPPSFETEDATTQAAPTISSPGRTIGPYRLLQRVGVGGMGEVWMAEQTHPVRRQVAVKIIKAGMDTAHVIARFEAERQALALMDHPVIATVFDGGSTAEGRPYFAMEYVKGEPITTYCDRNRLSTADRLALFIRVCEGVQHAHQKGVIHRDLKPSNILITLQDGVPVPKIIDFGVAKATTQHLTERTLFTEVGILIGTPEYMSPEQADLTGLDIDTRTDIYALGVLLYELLTGALPFDRQTLRQRGLDEIRRTIREVDPPRPSTRVTQLGPGSGEAAKNRDTEPSRLASQLRGDLDWITMRALEKDRTRRYDSATGLANDVRRHLDHEPVAASPPSTVYRTKKFVRRHRFGVAAGAVLVVLLAAFGVTMALQAQRIARERDRANREAETANQVANFLVGLFEVSDPGEARGRSVTAREILDQGAKKIDAELKDQPLVQARLMDTIGRVYSSLGLYDQAGPLLQRSVDQRRRLLGAAHADLADSLNNLAEVLLAKGDARGAAGLFREALVMRRLVSGDESAPVAESLNNLGMALKALGEWAESEANLRQALEVRRRVLGVGHKDTVQVLNNLGTLYSAKGDPKSAEPLYREALERRRALLGNDHPYVANSMNNLAGVLSGKGEIGPAEQLYREALALRRRLYGNQHPAVAQSLNNLAMLLRKKGDLVQAESLLREALDINRTRFGAVHPEVANQLFNLGHIAMARKDFPQAERWYRESLDMRRQIFSKDHPDIASAMFQLGGSLMRQNRFKDAEPYLVEAYRFNQRTNGTEHPFTQTTIKRLVELYDSAKQPDKAAEYRALVTKPAPAGR